MDKEFTQKTEIEKAACKILSAILNVPHEPRHLTAQHKQNSEYYDEFERQFAKSLTYEQTKDFDTLLSIRNAVESTEHDYAILCGMQIKSAIDEIMKNPLKILRLCDKMGTPAREIYKSVKQKMEEKL